MHVFVCVCVCHICLPLCLIKLAATRSTQLHTAPHNSTELHTAPQNSTWGKSAYQGSTSSTPSDVRSHRMHWLHHTHAECINDCIAHKHNKHKNTCKKKLQPYTTNKHSALPIESHKNTVPLFQVPLHVVGANSKLH